MSLARYSFLPWARRGMGALVEAPDTFGEQALPLRPTVPLSLDLEPATRIDHDVELRGPGDVIALDPRAVVRTEPRAGTTDFEPNYLACVELYDEDLPWRYTPARATPQHRLRPWIALIVLADDDEYTRVDARTIEVSAADRLFPAADQIWAWAHVHVNTDLAGQPSQLDAVVRANPDLAIARLLSPRRLEANTAYTAFIVPTFEAGRCAALRVPPQGNVNGGTPSWGNGQTTFPVFYQWSFRTGTAGDFESLARLIQPRELDERVGLRDLDVTSPAPHLLEGITEPPTLGLEGALRSISTRFTTWPREGEQFPARLTALVNAQLAQGDPVVTPPFYGQWHAARTSMGASTNPPWIEALNRDPRHRAAAGFGAEVIRRNQEELAAAAWAQIGAVLEANRALILAQLGRAITRSLHVRHVANLDHDRLLAMLAPIQTRVRVGSLTAREHVRRSAVPDAAIDRSFRRIVRRGGPVAKRFFASASSNTRWITRMNARELVASPVKPIPERALLAPTVRPPRTMAAANVATSALAARAQPAFRVTRPGEVLDRSPGGGADSPDAARFRAAVATLDAELDRAAVPSASQPPLAIQEMSSALSRAVDPDHSIKRRVLSRLRVSGLALDQRSDPLDTIMTAPEIDRPMYKPLGDISPDLLLPNIDLVPQNTASLLLTNNRFVESFLVGLNHEMARELLWREYPTDQRGSYFRCFWDTRDSLGAAPTRDIEAIHTWPPTSDLGDHIAGGTDRLVLVIRGDLLKKYPTAVVTAIEAVWPVGGGKRLLGAEERFPLFHAELEPDLTFLGFDLDVERAKGTSNPGDGKPGWFFVIKQRPGEPRFGLDETSPSATATSWDDLSWRNVAAETNIDLKPELRDANIPDHRRWGSNAADVADILFQRPVLIAIHASEMLP